MIREISIRNFKSIVDMTLDLGRINVIIGANGCGKTNILEAILFAAAANQRKLDKEFLLNRDMRIAEPSLMLNAFEEGSFCDEQCDGDCNVIEVSVKEDDKKDKKIRLSYSEEEKKWCDQRFAVVTPEDLKAAISFLDEKQKSDVSANIDSRFDRDFTEILRQLSIDAQKSNINSFLIYHPTERHLKEVKESPIYPIGVKGEGLLQYLREKSKQEEYKGMFKAINEGLGVLDWFDGVSLPADLMSNEYRLSIGDRYLSDSLHYFDQRSTNEGFMFLLFYLTLFNSLDTPPFFSIDNIETALNPKLCTELTSRLINTAKKKDKQVILTTHSPFVLDALDLSDDEVRLFVARRDIDGHTRLDRINYREDRKMLLSELWMSGLIGGLPDNF